MYNTELQARLSQYLKQCGLSQNAAAKQIGISETMLSQYRNSRYNGDVPAAERKIEEFLRTRAAIEASEAKNQGYRSSQEYVPTSISEDVYHAIQYCQTERGMMVLHGDAGIGKTKGAMRFVQENPTNAIYIKCTPIGGTLGNILKLLAQALKVPETRNKLDMILAIQDRLHGTDRVIIIDEAQNLNFRALEELRCLSDPDGITGERGTGICLIGNTQVYSRMLGKQEAQFAQLFSRVKLCRQYTTGKITRGDVEALFPALRDDKKALNLLHNISQSKWGIRGAVSVYNNAVNNETVSFDGLHRMALSMGVGIF